MVKEAATSKPAGTVRIAAVVSFLFVALIGHETFSQPTAQQIHTASGLRHGLCVYIDPPNGQILADLTNGGTMLVQGLTSDPAKLATLRSQIPDGVYGLASVMQVNDYKSLPYPRNFVNVLVADLSGLGGAAPSMDEVKRVVAPFGSYYLNNGGWAATKVPLPAAMDDWKYWDGKGDGNNVSHDSLVGPATSLQWHNGPNGVPNGNSYQVCLTSTSGGNAGFSDTELEYPYKDEGSYKGGPEKLYVRNAFNGILARAKEMQNYNYTYTSFLDQDTLFAPVEWKADGSEKVSKILAKTGEVLITYTNGLNYQRKPGKGDSYLAFGSDTIFHLMRATDRYLIQVGGLKMVVLDRGTGAVVWSKDAPAGKGFGFLCMNADQDTMYVAWSWSERVHGYSSSGVEMYQIGDIVAYDLATGTELWRNTELTDKMAADSTISCIFYQMAYHDGQLYVPWINKKPEWYAMPFYHHSVDAATGTTLWSTGKRQSRGIRGSSSPAGLGDIFINTERGANVYSRQTGAELGKGQGLEIGSGGCTYGRVIAGPKNYALNGQAMCEFNYSNGAVTWGSKMTPDISRSGCDVGAFPAYGMLYFSNGGYWKADWVLGQVAFSPEIVDAYTPDNERLITGTASVPNESGSGDWLSEDAWPMFRANPERGCAVEGTLPNELKIQWITKLASWHSGSIVDDWKTAWVYSPGLLTAISGRGDLICVAHPDAHKLFALSTSDGAVQWTFRAGGRIVAPPTLYKGLCFLSSNDGWVYALRADNGELVWRFLAARTMRMVGAGSQVESAWPVSGSLLIHKGNLIVNAGRQSNIDRGIHIWALDPLTGAIQWKTRADGHPDMGTADVPPTYTTNASRSLNLMLVTPPDRSTVYLTYHPLKDSYADGELVDIDMSKTKPTNIILPTFAGLESRVQHAKKTNEDNGRGNLYNFMKTNGSDIGWRQIAFKGDSVIGKDAAAIAVVGDLVITAAEANMITFENGPSIETPARVIRNGLAAFGGKVFAALEDGSVIMIGEGPGVSIADLQRTAADGEMALTAGWFRAGMPGNVSLKLCDLRGRTMKTFYDGIAGPNRVHYEIGGAALGSGIRLLVLQNGNRRLVKQIKVL